MLPIILAITLDVYDVFWVSDQIKEGFNLCYCQDDIYEENVDEAVNTCNISSLQYEGRGSIK